MDDPTRSVGRMKYIFDFIEPHERQCHELRRSIMKLGSNSSVY